MELKWKLIFIHWCGNDFIKDPNKFLPVIWEFNAGLLTRRNNKHKAFTSPQPANAPILAQFETLTHYFLFSSALPTASLRSLHLSSRELLCTGQWEQQEGCSLGQYIVYRESDIYICSTSCLSIIFDLLNLTSCYASVVTKTGNVLINVIFLLNTMT